MKLPLPIVLLFSLFFASCQSKDGDFTFFSTDEDLALGKQISNQIENDPENFPILNPAQHPELYDRLNAITHEILKSEHILHREEFAWQLKVIDNDTIYNAFCTPGGYIYLFTGLIKFVESEDELAGVIAHEIAHGDLRHSTDQMTKSYGIRLITRFLLGGDSDLLTNLGINLLGLKFSRSDEEEADLAAVQYLSETRYHPALFANFFKRIEKMDQGAETFQFLSTHPNPENRVEKIEAAWKQLGSKTGSDHSESFKKLQQSW